MNPSIKRVSVKADDVINDLVQWIDNNLDKPLRVTDVAARSGYSQWYLQRVFRRLMHVSVAEYIRQKKNGIGCQGTAGKSRVLNSHHFEIRLRIATGFYTIIY